VKCFLGLQQRTESLKRPGIFFSSALQITVVGRCKAKLLMPQKAEKGFRMQINPVKSMNFMLWFCYKNQPEPDRQNTNPELFFCDPYYLAV
jgi:hypothetical protein